MMGVASCLLFGIIASWITRAIQPSLNKGGIMLLLFTGLASGLIGCFLGILIGWGDMRMFNLYNVLLSMVVASAMVVAISKLIPVKPDTKGALSLH